MSERFEDECCNPGWGDKWTCPGCYFEIPDADPGEYHCPRCDRELVLRVDSQPVCVATIVEGEAP